MPLSLEHVLVAARAASEKTSEEVVVLDLSVLADNGAITDYFIVASGRTDRQVRAVVEEIMVQAKAAGAGRPRHAEGEKDAHWILLDYGDFVVHVFDTESREYYSLERLWSDAPRVAWDTAATATL